MRYLVLLVSSIAITVGFVVLKEALSEACERTYSTVGFAAAILAGSAYLIRMSFLIGAYVANTRDGKAPPTIAALSDVLEILLDAACLLTYLATAALAASFGRTRWLGRALCNSGLCDAEPHRAAVPGDKRRLIAVLVST
jgi:hypothetical protein